MVDSFQNNKSYLFKPNQFWNSKKELKVVLVYKKTRLEHSKLEKKSLKHHVDDRDLEDMKHAHQKHEETLNLVRETLKKSKVDLVESFRSKLSKDLVKDRLVITVGGDGTLLECSQYLTNSPVMGINSDPSRSVGSLCFTDGADFADTWSKLCDAKLHVLPVMRLECVLDGKKLPYHCLNEILITHDNPAAMSRYNLKVGKTNEVQKSSGIWVGAPAGSSGAIASAGGSIQPIEDDQVQFVVREPYISTPKAYALTKGLVPNKEAIEVLSRMQDGRLYFDGPIHHLPFKLGQSLVIKDSKDPLHMFISKESEEKRKQIGLSRNCTA